MVTPELFQLPAFMIMSTFRKTCFSGFLLILAMFSSANAVDALLP